MSVEDELKRYASGKIVQYATYESEDESVSLVTTIELTDFLDGFIELAFDMAPGRKRTYVRMRVEDFRRFLKQCQP